MRKMQTAADLSFDLMETTWTPMVKVSSDVIQALREAKLESDRKNYAGKHRLLRKLLAERPHEFHVDSTRGAFHGITHNSGFRMHLPRRLVADVPFGNKPSPVLDLQEAAKQANIEPWRQVPDLVAQAVRTNTPIANPETQQEKMAAMLVEAALNNPVPLRIDEYLVLPRFAPDQEFKKLAADAELTGGFTGDLYVSSTGWVLLDVPNALVRGAFDALHEPGIELPPGSSGGPFSAHISVMRKEELEQIGGASKLTERGQSFKWQMGPLKVCKPAGWGDVSKCWIIEVKSPELQKLRASYGLDPLPRYPFHITVAVRKKRIFSDSEVSKAANDESAMSLFTPSIPVDAFNNAVWSDAWQNPFGSKSTFGDNSQTLRTKPPVAAAITGIVAGAGARRDSDRVSPWDVALAAGQAAGKGWLGGLVLGKTVGMLAGLPPESQKTLQDAGLWGGMLTGAVKAVFK